MPKDTFFNLPPEKQQRVIDAALDEFADRTYYKARVTAIADKANIAKGSFYQYFTDKKDLFRHILEVATNEKLKYINQDMMQNRKKYGFFQLLREIYLSGIRFARENPKLVAIGNAMLNDKELQREIWGVQKDKSIDFFRQLLEIGMNKGELDPEIDINLVARMLATINYSIIDVFYEEGEINLDKLENKMEIIDRMIYFIKNGLNRKDN